MIAIWVLESGRLWFIDPWFAGKCDAQDLHEKQQAITCTNMSLHFGAVDGLLRQESHAPVLHNTHTTSSG